MTSSSGLVAVSVRGRRREARLTTQHALIYTTVKLRWPHQKRAREAAMSKSLGAIQRSLLIVLERRSAPLKADVLRVAVKRPLKQAPPINWKWLVIDLQERGLIHVDKDDNISITQEGKTTIKLLQMHE